MAHIVTGVIGSGVLSLPWSTAQLGWLAGPFSILLIASTTLFSSFLLCNTYRHPHPEYGPNRSASYLDVVHLHLGTYNSLSSLPSTSSVSRSRSPIQNTPYYHVYQHHLEHLISFYSKIRSSYAGYRNK